MANRFLSVPVRKDRVEPVVRRMVLALRADREQLDQAVCGGRCIPRGNIQRVRQERVLECRAGQGLEHHVRVWALRRVWLRRQGQEIVQHADRRSGVAETIATRSRRKVQ